MNKSGNLVQILPNNELGYDYLVGDIHGCFNLLQEALLKIGFNKKKDRLISTGDLIDRGGQSLECLFLLNEPWFYAVQGNHERMLLAKLQKISSKKLRFQANFYSSPIEKILKKLHPDEMQKIIAKILEMPLVLKIEDKTQSYYVVHAERIFKNFLLTDNILEDQIAVKENVEKITWGRSNIKKILRNIEKNKLDATTDYLTIEPRFLSNVTLTYVGHTIVPYHILYKSHFYLDRGAYLKNNKNSLVHELSIWKHRQIL